MWPVEWETWNAGERLDLLLAIWNLGVGVNKISQRSAMLPWGCEGRWRLKEESEGQWCHSCHTQIRGTTHTPGAVWCSVMPGTENLTQAPGEQQVSLAVLHRASIEHAGPSHTPSPMLCSLRAAGVASRALCPPVWPPCVPAPFCPCPQHGQQHKLEQQGWGLRC